GMNWSRHCATLFAPPLILILSRSTCKSRLRAQRDRPAAADAARMAVRQAKVGKAVLVWEWAAAWEVVCGPEAPSTMVRHRDIEHENVVYAMYHHPVIFKPERIPKSAKRFSEQDERKSKWIEHFQCFNQNGK